MIYRIVFGIDSPEAIVSSRFGLFWEWRYVLSGKKWSKVNKKYRAFFDPFIIFARKTTKEEIFVELL